MIHYGSRRSIIYVLRVVACRSDFQPDNSSGDDIWRVTDPPYEDLCKSPNIPFALPGSMAEAVFSSRIVGQACSLTIPLATIFGGSQTRPTKTCIRAPVSLSLSSPPGPDG